MASGDGPPIWWLERFDRVERVLHWVNAALFLVLIFTGVAIYLPALEALIGRRELVTQVHLYAGLALPVPLLIALSGSWGRALRADLGRFNRWSEDDLRWLRAALRGRAERRQARALLGVGKFNSGQKLNAAFTGGAGLVMLVTGIILHWLGLFPLAWRAGATFVHDWLALAIVVVVAGHIMMALADREALRSMLRGRISRSWAQRHAARWVEDSEE